MNQQEFDTFLEHHGVKGMKWGQRKKRSTARTAYEKSPSRLTDAQLTKRIGRLEKEKRYNELNARRVSKGEQMVTEILTNAGKNVATGLITGASLFAAKQLIGKHAGKEIADFIVKR